MNYLAHACLSGNDPRILAGNLLADVMKDAGSDKLHPVILQGVALHRKQDAFTDSHPAFKRSRRRLKGLYGHYSAVIVDVFYDYFLARDFECHVGLPLEDFVARVDEAFLGLWDEVQPVFTPQWRGMTWLKQYATIDGLQKAFGRIAKRSRRGVNLSSAIEVLKDDDEAFERDFREFLPDVRDYTDSCLTIFAHERHAV